MENLFPTITNLLLYIGESEYLCLDNLKNNGTQFYDDCLKSNKIKLSRIKTIILILLIIIPIIVCLINTYVYLLILLLMTFSYFALTYYVININQLYNYTII